MTERSTPASREALWNAVGGGLAGPRYVRDRTANRLAELSPSLARTAIAHGLLAAISQDEALAAEARRLLISRRFNSRALQRARRGGAWQRRQLRAEGKVGRSDSAGRFAMLDRDALIVVLRTAVKPVERGAAATALGALGDRNAVQPLCDALKDDDASVRGSAATALGALGDRSAVRPLCDTLKDDDPHTRGAAATALGALGDRSAAQPLCDALKDDDAHTRGSAATALGALGDRNAMQPLCDALKDSAPKVRGSAATALGALGDRNAVRPLCDALKDDDAHTRGSAATALGALGDRNAVQPLCDALKDDDAHTRGSAATALGALGDRNAVQPLCDALKDDAPVVRGSAATALGALGDQNAVQPLCDALKDDDLRVRGSAATALGALGDRSAAQPLCDALKDDNRMVRGSAAMALGALGDRGAVQPLCALLSDSIDQVRLSAASALGALADQIASDDVILPLVDAARRNSEPSVRTSAIMALSRHERVDLPLVRYLLDPDFKRADGRRRDTDWGVQGQTTAAVLRAYARSVPGDEALAIVARFLREADTRYHALRAALAPLADLPPPALKRALADLTARVPSPPDRVAEMLEKLREKLEQYELAEQSLAELASSAAETLRVVFPPVPRPWFEKQPESPSVSRTAVLLTAASIEARSVYEGLERHGVHLEQARVAGHKVDSGTFAFANGAHWRVILAQPIEKGPHAMQSLAKDVLTELRPNLLLMVGMCGGIEENGANENAVIVAKQVLNYEPRRLRTDGSSLTPSGYRCDPRILDCLNAIGRRGVLDRAVEGDEAPIELLPKAIGSGEKLIDDLKSPERANIVGLSGDLVGVEQEGHGLYHPLWEDLLRGAPPAYALIKGVSDLADGRMPEKKSERQTRATLRALTVALAIIENFA